MTADGTVQGLALCEVFFKNHGAPMIEEKFPSFKDRIAAGLVGDGSECYGFDDELSRDHDWGPGFCLWLNAADYADIGSDLQAAYDALPKAYAGFRRHESAWGGGRTGVFETGQFYRKFTGLDRAPADLHEWRMLPETSLAAATTGRVFRDPAGEFTAVRDALLAYYPEDVRLKRMAARCMNMAQAGQYNYPRCVRRRERVAAAYAESQFVIHCISMVYLMNRRYKPFYKWMHRGLKALPLLGEAMYGRLDELATAHERFTGAAVYEEKTRLIEAAAQDIIAELKREGLTDTDSDFLLDHGPAVQAHIKDEGLRAASAWVD